MADSGYAKRREERLAADWESGSASFAEQEQKDLRDWRKRAAPERWQLVLQLTRKLWSAYADKSVMHIDYSAYGIRSWNAHQDADTESVETPDDKVSEPVP